MNKKKLLNIFIWGIAFVMFIATIIINKECNRTRRNNIYSISKNVISKIRFGKSPKCGKIDCWMEKDYDDSSWDIIPLPLYDFRVHPDYPKGLSDGMVYYRIKLKGVNNLNCNKKHMLPLLSYSNNNIVSLYIGDKEHIKGKINESYFHDNEIIINISEGSECRNLIKNEGLIVVKSFIDRRSLGLYFYFGFQLIPEDMFHKYFQSHAVTCSVYSVYFLCFMTVFFIMLVYLLTPKFLLYEFLYIFGAFLYALFLLTGNLIIIKKNLRLEYITLLLISQSMLFYLLKNYNIKEKKFNFIKIYMVGIFIVNIISYIFFFSNMFKWTFWNFLYTIKGSYFITLLLIFIFIIIQQESKAKNTKDDLLFFLGHILIAVYCLYDHISLFEPFWILFGTLFFLHKKLLRLIDGQILIKNNNSELDQMDNLKLVGKVFLSLTHDLKKPLTQVKSLFETNERSLQEENLHVVAIKNEMEQVNKVVHMLLKVVEQSSHDKEYFFLGDFLKKILPNDNIEYKYLDKYKKLSLLINKDFYDTFDLLSHYLKTHFIEKYDQENKEEKIILSIEKFKWNLYLKVSVPFDLFDKDSEYMIEHDQNTDKKNVRCIHYNCLKWAFIKKNLNLYMENSDESDNKDYYNNVSKKEFLIRLYKR